jgi:hypothetical protein
MSLSYVGRSDRKLEALWHSMQLHMNYLRSLEESERVRASCLKYLQNYVIDFYPVRPDILQQLQETAHQLGGQLKAPRLSWKYSWIKALFGWNCAQRAQMFLPGLKWSFLRWWDRMAFRLTNRDLRTA